MNLTVLEDFIDTQSDDSWSQPILVATKIENLYKEISHSKVVGTVLRTLSKDELDTLYRLELQIYGYLPHPPDMVNSDTNFTEEDIELYEELGEMISDIGLTIQEEYNADAMIDELEQLVIQIDAKEAAAK